MCNAFSAFPKEKGVLLGSTPSKIRDYSSVAAAAGFSAMGFMVGISVLRRMYPYKTLQILTFH
jgi:hypothetical protein